ncbi:hypothetical protein BJ170DRAFT_693066 [Xylariales sp. AK1849]|nr:hypothetical protein BJ170DRAFT_693066 [Xylariales sp. AK1849]
MMQPRVGALPKLEGFIYLRESFLSEQAIEILLNDRHVPKRDVMTASCRRIRKVESNLIVLFQIHARFQAYYMGYRDSNEYWPDVAGAFGLGAETTGQLKTITNLFVKYRAMHYKRVIEGTVTPLLTKSLLHRLVDDEMRFIADQQHKPQFSEPHLTNSHRRYSARDDMRKLLLPEKKASLFKVAMPNPWNTKKSLATMPLGDRAELLYQGFTRPDFPRRTNATETFGTSVASDPVGRPIPGTAAAAPDSTMPGSVLGFVSGPASLVGENVAPTIASAGPPATVFQETSAHDEASASGQDPEKAKAAAELENYEFLASLRDGDREETEDNEVWPHAAPPHRTTGDPHPVIDPTHNPLFTGICSYTDAQGLMKIISAVPGAGSLLVSGPCESEEVRTLKYENAQLEQDKNALVARNKKQLRELADHRAYNKNLFQEQEIYENEITKLKEDIAALKEKVGGDDTSG